MYLKLILRNVFRNLQTYTIYFFSLTLIYSLLYAFNALPSHPVMQSLSGAKEMLTTVMSQYMGLLSYLILSAIAFLVVYSTNFVLGRRKKELGLYATLGMKKKQIIRTLFFETMLVNIFSLILGFLLGLILLVILSKVASEFFMANYFGSLLFFDSKSVILLVYSYLVTSLLLVSWTFLPLESKISLHSFKKMGSRNLSWQKASQFFKHFSLFFRQLLSVLVLSIFQTITIYHS